MDRFTLYLEWMRNGVYKPRQDVSRIPVSQVDDTDRVVVTSTLMAVTTPAAPKVVQTYRIAKLHPAALSNIPAVEIIAGHAAGYFLEAVMIYISPHSPFIPQPYDRFNLYKRLTFSLPAIPEASANKYQNVVRASPPLPVRGTHFPAQPAHLDFTLICTGEENDKTAGTALQGAHFDFLCYKNILMILF
jgi:hypothetical protein